MSTSTVRPAAVSVASGQQLGAKKVTTRHVALPARVALSASQTVTPRPVG